MPIERSDICGADLCGYPVCERWTTGGEEEHPDWTHAGYVEVESVCVEWTDG